MLSAPLRAAVSLYRFRDGQQLGLLHRWIVALAVGSSKKCLFHRLFRCFSPFPHLFLYSHLCPYLFTLSFGSTSDLCIYNIRYRLVIRSPLFPITAVKKTVGDRVKEPKGGDYEHGPVRHSPAVQIFVHRMPKEETKSTPRTKTPSRSGYLILTSSAIQCNKIFPCIHCKSRGVQRNCIFKEKPAKPANPPPQASGATTSKTTAGVGASKKRYRGGSEDSNSDSDSDAGTGNGGLDSVGENGVAMDSGNPGPLVPEQSSAQLTQLSSGTQVRPLTESSD